MNFNFDLLASKKNEDDYKKMLPNFFKKLRMILTKKPISTFG